MAEGGENAGGPYTRRIQCDDADRDHGNGEESGMKMYLKTFIILECAVLAFMGIFYYSCGEALYIRESDGCVAEFPATGDIGELKDGDVLEQIFTSQMDLVDAVGVLVSNYGKPLQGSLHVRVEDAADRRLITEQTFAAGELGVNQYVWLSTGGVRKPRGRQVRVTCTSDGIPGSAPTVLYTVEDGLKNADVAKDAGLFLNGEPVAGTMCIVLQGRDIVWTGPNYWKLTLAAALFAAAMYAVAVCRRKNGRRSWFFLLLDVLKKYGFLIRQLVARDFKVRYKRSVLGVFWSFLNPLLTMVVQYIVFSQLFRSDIENYPVYLLSGLVVFNFFSEGVGQALGSIVGNASLITKVYIPKYIYPVTRVLSSGINLLMSLAPLMIAALLTGEQFTKAYWMLPYILGCVMVFTAGLGMILAAGMAFFRDIQFLWGILSMLWMYLTPLFYPVSIVPEGFRGAVLHNPMYVFVGAVRDIVMEGMAPRPMVFFQCTWIALVMLAIGSLVFKKTQDRFVFYI